MTDQKIRVFVGPRGYDLDPTATALDAVRASDPALADGVVGGTRRITDSRGLDVAPDTAAYAGAIYRVVGAGRPPS